MKIILTLVLIMSMLFSGCNITGDVTDKMKSPGYSEEDSITQTSDNNNLNNTNMNNEKDRAESEKAYHDFIDLIQSNKKPYELISFLDNQIVKVITEHADEMVLALEEVQKVYESYYQQMFFDSNAMEELNQVYKDSIGTQIIEKIKNKDLNSLVSEVLKSGYKLVSVEGTVYPVLDYEYLKKYLPNVSAKMADYINIMATESENVAAVDAALVISRDELFKRMIVIEEFTDKYNGFARNDLLKYHYYRYMNMYLAGLDNTPAYEHETNKYKNDFIQNFNKHIQSSKNTQTADIVKQYMEVIKAGNNYYTEQARKFISDLYKENLFFEGKYKNKLNFKYVNEMLAKLLPEKPGYKWLYNGFAEYGHQMTLLEISAKSGSIIYKIEGKVADMSDGESGKGEEHFKIDLQYTIENASIIQTKKENIMMDSDMDSIEIIRAPLVKGNKWMQIATDKSGKDRYLNCEITEINEIEGSKVYTVEYKDLDSDYYEIRMIEEGIGVVALTKLWDSGGNGAFEIGYSIYKEASGYFED